VGFSHHAAQLHAVTKIDMNGLDISVAVMMSVFALHNLQIIDVLGQRILSQLTANA